MLSTTNYCPLTETSCTKKECAPPGKCLGMNLANKILNEHIKAIRAKRSQSIPQSIIDDMNIFTKEERTLILSRASEDARAWLNKNFPKNQ